MNNTIQSPLNEAIRNIQMPEAVAKLPISRKGFPVPWFVAKVNGEWDFRTVYSGRVAQAIKENRCWICGEQLGRRKVFAIGPMCAVNRVTSEPPCHLACAEYAVRACPFLVNPRMRRNDKDLPEGHFNSGGIMIRRNPAVTALWFTKHFRRFDAGNGFLIRVGRADDVRWYREGRRATLEEVKESIDTGYPQLQEIAEEQGPRAVQELERSLKLLERYMPTA
jgi:hypothetical protein